MLARESASEVALLARGRSWDSCEAIRAVFLGRLYFGQLSERALRPASSPVACAESQHDIWYSQRTFSARFSGCSDGIHELAFRFDSDLTEVLAPASPKICSLCCLSFRVDLGLAARGRSKHGAPVHLVDTPGQTCPLCSKQFSTRSNMIYHLRHHCRHISELPPQDPLQVFDDNSFATVSEDTLQHSFQPQFGRVCSGGIRTCLSRGVAGVADALDDGPARLAQCLGAQVTHHHEQDRQNRARSENLVLQGSVDHPLFWRLSATAEHYDQEGRATRRKQGADHLQRKSPDALFRAVLFRLAKLFRENQAHLAQQTLDPCVSGPCGRGSGHEQGLEGTQVLRGQDERRSGLGIHSVDL